jgi:hypothetical protein
VLKSVVFVVLLEEKSENIPLTVLKSLVMPSFVVERRELLRWVVEQVETSSFSSLKVSIPLAMSESILDCSTTAL